MRLKFGKWPETRQKTDNTGMLNAPKKLENALRENPLQNNL